MLEIDKYYVDVWITSIWSKRIIRILSLSGKEIAKIGYLTNREKYSWVAAYNEVEDNEEQIAGSCVSLDEAKKHCSEQLKRMG